MAHIVLSCRRRLHRRGRVTTGIDAGECHRRRDRDGVGQIVAEIDVHARAAGIAQAQLGIGAHGEIHAVAAAGLRNERCAQRI